MVSLMIDSYHIMSKLFFVWQFFQWYKISEHPAIPATTHLGLFILCINSSKAWQTDIPLMNGPAVMKRWGQCLFMKGLIINCTQNYFKLKYDICIRPN